MMRSDYYEAVVPQDSGSVVCLDCLGRAEIESDYPVFASSEWDCIPSCDACLRALDYVSLTTDGIEYTREQLRNGGNPEYQEIARQVLRAHGVDTDDE